MRKPQSKSARVLLSPILYHGYRIFVACLFLYAGATKLADTAGFAESIAAYRILPDPLVPCAAMGLPAAEVLAGFGALLNRRWGILGITGMMVLFLGVLSYGVATGLNIDCGCFDTQAKPAAAEPVQPVPLLSIPGVDDGGGASTVVQIEPVPGPGTGDDGTCSEDNSGSSSLEIALIRDILLFLGVLYLLGWPDLRRKYGLEMKPGT